MNTAEGTPPLRDLFRAQYDQSHYSGFVSELSGASDRAAAIILVSMVERYLEELILTKISIGFTMSKSRREALFDRNGPLSEFGGNIKMGYALYLYPDRVRKDLDAVRQIRNVFAHSAIPIRFTESEISVKTLALRQATYENLLADEIISATSSEERRAFIMGCMQLLEDLADATAIAAIYAERVTLSLQENASRDRPE